MFYCLIIGVEVNTIPDDDLYDAYRKHILAELRGSHTEPRGINAGPRGDKDHDERKHINYCTF